MRLLNDNESGSPAGWAWPLALALTTIVGSLATACMMPFVALAVMTGATMTPGRAAGAMAVIWLANQAIGFALLGFPPTAYTFAWAFALASASLTALAVSCAILGTMKDLAAFRLGAALAGAFVAYEVLLFGFASIAGGLETFTPTVVAQIAANEAVWCVALVALRIALTSTAPRLFGPAPAMRFAW